MNNKLFSQRLRYLRKKAGYSSAEAFAEKYNELYMQDGSKDFTASYKGYENERKRSNPSIDVLLNICDMLQCDLDYLCGRIDNETHKKKLIEEETGLNSLSVDYLNEEVAGDSKRVKKSKFTGVSISDFLNYATFINGIAKEGGLDAGQKLFWIEHYIMQAVLYDGSLNERKHNNFQKYMKGSGAEYNAWLHNNLGAGIVSHSELYETYIHRAVSEFEDLIRSYIEVKSQNIAEKIRSGAATPEADNGRNSKSSLPSNNNT